MKIDNKSFWEDNSVIKTQDQVNTKSADFELFLYNKLLSKNVKSPKIKIFGCGTGREINEINKLFPDSKIIASDISENMIKKCNENLKDWNLTNVKTIACNAVDYEQDLNNPFDMVTIMNSMLTYVTDKNQRDIIFKKSFKGLKAGGVIVGVVHNQNGAPLKTIYFKIRRLLKFYLKNKVGHRYSGFKGYKVLAHYFTKQELSKHLEDSGFKEIEIYSLKEFYNIHGKGNYRISGYNNLIFSAKK